MDAPSPGSSLLAARPRFPYPGLRPFEAEEWSIFFGRETMVDEVIDRLAQRRFVLIHGASGSGKSSLVRAGVLPKLARQHLRHGTAWLTCAMRPSGGPLWNLAAKFAQLEGREGDQARITDIIRLFNRRGATLSKVVGSLAGVAGKRLCILVDQFEELFRFERETSREEAELFIDLLVGEIPQATELDAEADPDAAAEPGGQAGLLHIIITMRSEFLGECARFDGLAEVINRTQYLVPRLSHPELLRAITRPAELYGGEVTAELADRLIADVRGKPDELPLIQHGLMLFWHTATQSGGTAKVVLTAAMLDRAGGLAQLLSDHADRVMRAAAPDEPRKAAVERLFRALTDINAEGQAIRRPQSFQDLSAVCGVPEGNLHAILDVFRAEGVSFLTPYSPTPIKDKTVIDISHEALIRCWNAIGDRQNGWLRREFDDGLMWRSLLIQAEEFERDKKRVLSPASTAERERWIVRQIPAWSDRYGGRWALVDRLLRASRKQVVRARRRRSLIELPIVALAAASLLAMFDQFMDGMLGDETTKFGNFAGAVLVIWTLLITMLIIFDHGSEFVRRILARRRARANVDIGAVPAKYKPGFTNFLPPRLIRFWLGARRYWYVPVFASYFVFSDSVLWPLIWDPVKTELDMGSRAYDARNYDLALRWYLKAGEHDDAVAQLNVGRLLRSGKLGKVDYQGALNWFRKAADQGNSDAQTELGTMFEQGLGVGQNDQEAMNWFRKAAARDNASAERKIGQLYYKGSVGGSVGAPDKQQAAIWFRKAAEQGDSDAQNDLGLLYETGDGVEKDPKEAMNWYRKAAERGNPTARYNVGLSYRDGVGVPADMKQAYEWLHKAAEQGYAKAQLYVGDMLYEGKEINGTDAKPDYPQALAWYRKAADQGEAEAQFAVAGMYRDGLGVVTNDQEAMKWYRKAAEQGHADAQFAIGGLYQQGRGVKKDDVEAMYWYRKAADQGNPRAEYSVGIMYHLGEGVPQVDAEAMMWYRKAAEQGNADAQNGIGELYMNGSGVPRDYGLAMTWFHKAAGQGVARASPRAEYHIGQLYEHGWGVTKDEELALGWMRKAANGGDEMAKEWLKSH